MISKHIVSFKTTVLLSSRFSRSIMVEAARTPETSSLQKTLLQHLLSTVPQAFSFSAVTVQLSIYFVYIHFILKNVRFVFFFLFLYSCLPWFFGKHIWQSIRSCAFNFTIATLVCTNCSTGLTFSFHSLSLSPPLRQFWR